MQIKTQFRVLEVADRPGWAIDRLSKCMAKIYKDIDIAYFAAGASRYLDTGYSDWKTATQFTEEVAKGYDIIHFHRVESAMKYNWSKIEGKKVITVHTEREKDWENPDLKKFDAIIALTKYAEEHCEKTFLELRDKLYYIPQGIDLSFYYPVGVKPQDKEIGYVGRIVPWKRWDVVKQATHNAGLKLIGCGYIEDGGCYNHYGLREGIDYEFHIFIPEPQMRNFYARLNLFLCISAPHIEAGPLPILEAMACGVPVISTKVGWAADNCTHGENIVFVDDKDAQDPRILGGIIKSTYENKDFCQRLRENALKLMKNHSIERYAADVMKVYLKIMHNKI